MKTPVLAYPSFEQNAAEFILQTDASAVGLGAVFEQQGRVIAYASRSLTSSERNYSVIQRECLAIIFALKQFRHYLLGHPSLLNTDHAPLQWLSAQKMEGMLCRWALALQEYDFKILYRRGSLNTNADALSRMPMLQTPCAVTMGLPHFSYPELRTAQLQDSTLSVVLKARQHSNEMPSDKKWRSPLFQGIDSYGNSLLLLKVYSAVNILQVLYIKWLLYLSFQLYFTRRCYYVVMMLQHQAI